MRVEKKGKIGLPLSFPLLYCEPTV
jgi:hypothetical protein